MPYRVYGSVVEEESGRPLEGLVIRAYDEDIVVDDHLGDTCSDVSGRFEITFTEVQFMDFHETRPDLYVRVFDETGTRLLHTTEDAVRSNARGDECFDIRIARDRLGTS